MLNGLRGAQSMTDTVPTRMFFLSSYAFTVLTMFVVILMLKNEANAKREVTFALYGNFYMLINI